MRDFRDAKAMAHALRGALKAKSVDTTHSESLELIAKAFGYEDWNILSAKIEAVALREAAGRARSPAGTPATNPQATLFCTFCGKSQHDVRTLIEGPSSTYICDECVVVCNDVIDERRSCVLQLAEDRRRARKTRPIRPRSSISKVNSTEDLVSFMERSRRATQLYRAALQSIQHILAIRDGEAQADRDVMAAPRFAKLKDQSREELLHPSATQRARAQARRGGAAPCGDVLADAGSKRGQRTIELQPSLRGATISGLPEIGNYLCASRASPTCVRRSNLDLCHEIASLARNDSGAGVNTAADHPSTVVRNISRR